MLYGPRSTLLDIFWGLVQLGYRVIRWEGDVSVLEADGRKKKWNGNPQLEIGATCFFVSDVLVSSSATRKCSFQLV